MTAAPMLQIRYSDEEFGRWFVAAKWSDGRTEEIVSFDNEVEATEWITNNFQGWLEQQTKARWARN